MTPSAPKIYRNDEAGAYWRVVRSGLYRSLKNAAAPLQGGRPFLTSDFQTMQNHSIRRWKQEKVSVSRKIVPTQKKDGSHPGRWLPSYSIVGEAANLRFGEQHDYGCRPLRPRPSVCGPLQSAGMPAGLPLRKETARLPVHRCGQAFPTYRCPFDGREEFQTSLPRSGYR